MAKRRRRESPDHLPYLPAEILPNILKRLPVKDIVRYRTICKPWLDLLTSPFFINLHSHHQKRLVCSEDETLIVANRDTSFLYTVDLLSAKACANKVNLVGLYIHDIVGSCNGLLLCICKDCPNRMLYEHLAVVNPTTLEHIMIPSAKRMSSVKCIRYGFGYDFVADDYKIVRIVNTRVMVYSLKAGTWKYFEEDTIPRGSFTSETDYGALINNHLLHWSFEYGDRESSGFESAIFCFDVCTEEWSKVPLPDDYLRTKTEYPSKHRLIRSVGVVEGYLCFRANKFVCGDPNAWVMTEYGVSDSWTELYAKWNCDIERSLRLPPIVISIDMYSGSYRKLLLKKHDPDHGWSAYKFFWYEAGRIQEVEIPGVPYHCQSTVCIRSLVPLCWYGRTDDGTKARKTKRGGTSVRRSVRMHNKRIAEGGDLVTVV